MPEINEIRKYADFIRDKLKNQNIIDIKILNVIDVKDLL